MELKIIKDDKSIRFFIGDTEIPFIKSFKVERDDNGIQYIDLTLKVLLKELKFENIGE